MALSAGWIASLVGVAALTVGCGTERGRTDVVSPSPTDSEPLELSIEVPALARASIPPPTFPTLGGAVPITRVAPGAASRAVASRPVVLPTEDEITASDPVVPAATTGVAGAGDPGAGTSAGGSAGTSGGASRGGSGFSGEPIGYLDAPSIGLATFVLENGWSTRQLNRGGAGSGGAPLGSAGNVVFFGHRTSHGGVFRHIDGLVVGAEVDVTIAYGPTQRYTVVDRFLDMPDAVHWVDPSNTIEGRPTVTLVSCAHADGSPGGTARRWFVRAVAL